MNPTMPPFMYICKNCGSHFSLQIKVPVLPLNPLKALTSSSLVSGNLKTIGPKCPDCGSHNTDVNRLIMK